LLSGFRSFITGGERINELGTDVGKKESMKDTARRLGRIYYGKA